MSGEPERAWGPGEALGRAVRPSPPTLSPTDQLTEFVPIFGRYPESPCCGREEQGHPPSPAGLPPLTWLTFLRHRSAQTWPPWGSLPPRSGKPHGPSCHRWSGESLFSQNPLDTQISHKAAHVRVPRALPCKSVLIFSVSVSLSLSVSLSGFLSLSFLCPSFFLCLSFLSLVSVSLSLSFSVSLCVSLSFSPLLTSPLPTLAPLAPHQQYVRTICPLAEGLPSNISTHVARLPSSLDSVPSKSHPKSCV